MTPKSFVLVHGFTQGPTGWDRLRPVLEANGHETVAVGLRLEELAEAGGIECAEVIADTVKAATLPVHLVGTSGSGALLPLVPAISRVEQLVFICAGMPAIGRSLSQQIAEDGVLTDEWMAEPDTSSLDGAERFMFNDCDGETLQWALTTVRLFNPARVYEEVCPLQEWPDVTSTYILGTRDRIIYPAWSRSAVPDRLGVRPIEVTSGHCPQVSMPRELASILTANRP